MVVLFGLDNPLDTTSRSLKTRSCGSLNTNLIYTAADLSILIQAKYFRLYYYLFFISLIFIAEFVIKLFESSCANWLFPVINLVSILWLLSSILIFAIFSKSKKSVNFKLLFLLSLDPKSSYDFCKISISPMNPNTNGSNQLEQTMVHSNSQQNLANARSFNYDNININNNNNNNNYNSQVNHHYINDPDTQHSDNINITIIIDINTIMVEYISLILLMLWKK